jgi:hypothetical protein
MSEGWDAVRILRLRRRRSGVPGVFLIYHAVPDGLAEVAAGTVVSVPGVEGWDAEWDDGIARESALALAPEEGRDVERRGRLELGSRAHVVRRRHR